MELGQVVDLYSQAILDHWRSPCNFRQLQGADIQSDGVNSFCGDEIHLQLILDASGRVTRVGLQGVGCSINQASGSMLTEIVEGKALDEILKISSRVRSLMDEEGTSPSISNELGNLEALISVRQFPIRIKCVLLAWSTLEEGIENYINKRMGDGGSRTPIG